MINSVPPPPCVFDLPLAEVPISDTARTAHHRNISRDIGWFQSQTADEAERAFTAQRLRHYVVGPVRMRDNFEWPD